MQWAGSIMDICDMIMIIVIIVIVMISMISMIRINMMMVMMMIIIHLEKDLSGLERLHVHVGAVHLKLIKIC